jgi:hypothetical protein
MIWLSLYRTNNATLLGKENVIMVKNRFENMTCINTLLQSSVFAFVALVILSGLAVAATDPEVRISPSSDFEAQINQTFVVTFYLKDIGTSSSTDIGYLDVSLPDYGMLAESPYGPFDSAFTITTFNVNDMIWNRYDVQIPAQYPLFSAQHTGWNSNEEHYMTWTFKCWQTGTFRIFFRGAMGSGPQSNFNRDPSGDSDNSKPYPKDHDQQGWTVWVLNVNIQPANEPNLVAEWVHPTNGTPPFTVGQTVDFRVRIKNEGGATSPSGYVGYYIGNSPEDFSNRIDRDFFNSLDPGAATEVHQGITFSASDVGTQKYLNVYVDYENEIDETYEYTDNIAYFGPFEVIGANTPPSLTITSPTGSVAVMQGDLVSITWTDQHYGNTASISLAYDTDCSEGGQTWIATNITEDPTPPGGSNHELSWNTGGVPLGTYNIWGILNDNVNAPVYSCALGTVTITERKELEVVTDPPGCLNINPDGSFAVAVQVTHEGMPVEGAAISYIFWDCVHVTGITGANGFANIEGSICDWLLRALITGCHIEDAMNPGYMQVSKDGYVSFSSDLCVNPICPLDGNYFQMDQYTIASYCGCKSLFSGMLLDNSSNEYDLDGYGQFYDDGQGISGSYMIISSEDTTETEYNGEYQLGLGEEFTIEFFLKTLQGCPADFGIELSGICPDYYLPNTERISFGVSEGAIYVDSYFPCSDWNGYTYYYNQMVNNNAWHHLICEYVNGVIYVMDGETVLYSKETTINFASRQTLIGIRGEVNEELAPEGGAFLVDEIRISNTARYPVHQVPPVVTITSPSGGEAWSVGDVETITWSLLGGQTNHIEILISRDGGSNYEPDPIAILDYQGEDSYNWTVAGPNSSNCKIKVVATGSGGSGEAVSPNFSIEQPLDKAYVQSVAANRVDNEGANHVTISQYGFWRSRFDRFSSWTDKDQDVSCLKYVREGLWAQLTIVNPTSERQIGEINTVVGTPNVDCSQSNCHTLSPWPFSIDPNSSKTFNIPVFFETSSPQDIDCGEYRVFFRFQEEFDFQHPNLIVEVTNNELQPPPNAAIGNWAVFDFSLYPSENQPTLIDYTNLVIFLCQIAIMASGNALPPGGLPGDLPVTLQYLSQFSQDFWAETRAALLSAASCDMKSKETVGSLTTIETKWRTATVVPQGDMPPQRIPFDRAICALDLKVGPSANYPTISGCDGEVSNWTDGEGNKHTFAVWVVYGIDKQITWDKGSGHVQYYTKDLTIQHETDIDASFNVALQMGPYRGMIGVDEDGAIIDYGKWQTASDQVYWLTVSTDMDKMKIEGKGIQEILGENLLKGQAGSIKVKAVAPKTGEYAVEVFSEYFWHPGWGLSPRKTEKVHLDQGDEHVFEFQVLPTTDLEVFRFWLWKDSWIPGVPFVEDKSTVTISTSNGINYTIKSPVTPELIDPNGVHYTKTDTSQNYVLFYDSHNAVDEHQKNVYVPYPLDGIYTLLVYPDSTATLDSTYSIIVNFNGRIDTLAYRSTIANIPPEGYFFNTLPFGSLSGFVTTNSVQGLLGVNVAIYDSVGNLWQSLVSNDSGYYQIDSVPNGNYSISVITPLGYQADQETKEFTINHVPVTVNFALTKLSVTPRQRSRAYWADQLCRALQNKPKDYTRANFSRFAGLINVHFNQNEVNPVDFYTVPQPANQTDSLMVMKKILTMCNNENEPFLKRLAKAQLMALMLNVVSGKIHQTQTISADNRTVSQAITFCDQLIGGEITCPDNIPGHNNPNCPYILSELILNLINVGAMVPGNLIPANVLQIAYDIHIPESIPEHFALNQNYPNPFNPMCEISYALPTDCHVTLTIYNVLGQRVKVLVDEHQNAGNKIVSWDSKDDQGQEVTSGIYFYRIHAGDFMQSKKMVLLR